MDISTQNTSNYHDQFLQAAVMVSLFSGALIALFPRDLYNDISSRPVLFFSLRKCTKKILDVSIRKIGYVVGLFGGQRRQYDLT